MPKQDRREPLLQSPSLRDSKRSRRTLVCSASDMARVVLWFKNDLRVRDNYILDRAADLVAKGEAKEVTKILCFVQMPLELGVS